jgi:hypothetical protein
LLAGELRISIDTASRPHAAPATSAPPAVMAAVMLRGPVLGIDIDAARERIAARAARPEAARAAVDDALGQLAAAVAEARSRFDQ